MSKAVMEQMLTTIKLHEAEILQLESRNAELTKAMELCLRLIQIHYLDYWGIDSSSKDYEPIAEIHKLLKT